MLFSFLCNYLLYKLFICGHNFWFVPTLRNVIFKVFNDILNQDDVLDLPVGDTTD